MSNPADTVTIEISDRDVLYIDHMVVRRWGTRGAVGVSALVAWLGLIGSEVSDDAWEDMVRQLRSARARAPQIRRDLGLPDPSPKETT